MSRLIRRIKIRGFTLIELLVVIAIIATLAAILTPVVSKALLRGRVTQTINNGYNLYRLLFFEELDNPLGLQSAGATIDWPTTADAWSDANAYFATLVTNDAFELNYAFFVAPGMRPAGSEQEFLTDTATLRNIWCITLDVGSGVKFGAPVLFTQNVNIPGTTLDTMAATGGLLENAKPYQDKAAVVVAYGGSAFSIDANTATTNNFNPPGAINGFIAPKGGDITGSNQ